MVAERKFKQDTTPAGGSMLFTLSGFFLNQIIRDSRLDVVCRDSGRRLSTGRGDGERYEMSVDSAQTLWEIITNPDPGAGELFMDGKWEMTQGDLGAFLTMMARNLQAILASPAGFVFSAVLKKKLAQRERDETNSREFVRRHYDLGNDLYELFLDEGMNYSCAFFEGREMSLREAQLNKLRTTISRLGIEPGMRVLDIGCGWGEACRLIAQETGAAAVTGITLARNQLSLARERALSMTQPPDYRLEDYRAHARENPHAYDRIVSIGMFEHVGLENYRSYFAAIRTQLAPRGRALVHSIVNAAPQPGKVLNGPWLERYIFPGGRIPDLPEMLEAAQAEGLRTVRPPYLQPPADYAETLRCWRRNFSANESRLDPAKYDARFRRMWIYYLSLCEAMFDGCGFQIAQVVFEQG